jgi:hypothetical protein
MCDAKSSVLKSRLTVLKNDALVSYVLLGVNFNKYIVVTFCFTLTAKVPGIVLPTYSTHIGFFHENFFFLYYVFAILLYSIFSTVQLWGLHSLLSS